MEVKEILQKVWDFYVKESGKPGYSDGSCDYYIDDKQRCAIGCLLPVEKAKEITDKFPDGIGVTGLLSYPDVPESIRSAVKGLVPTDLTDLNDIFLETLQCVHDDLAPLYLDNEEGYDGLEFGTRLMCELLERTYNDRTSLSVWDFPGEVVVAAGLGDLAKQLEERDVEEEF